MLVVRINREVQTVNWETGKEGVAETGVNREGGNRALVMGF